MSTAVDWREIARRARLLRANRKPQEQEPSSSSSPPAESPPAMPNLVASPIRAASFSAAARRSTSASEGSAQDSSNRHDAATQRSKHASMDFTLPSGKRSSWTMRHGSKPRPPPPPPPPAIPQRRPSTVPESEFPRESRENFPPEQPLPAPPHTSDNPMSTTHNMENAHTPMKKPGEAAATGMPSLKPLHDRTNASSTPAAGGKRGPPKSAAKPFAKLVKDASVNYYDMLEISPNASEKDIVKAFRTWCKVVHPDHNRNASATEDFQALQQVYETLKAPASRVAYNCREKFRRSAYGNRFRRPNAATSTTNAVPR